MSSSEVTLPLPRGVPIVIDDLGDVVLVVGSLPGTVYELTACSRTVARTSRAFRALLWGGYKESAPASGEWRVYLPEDDPKAFEVFLRYIHTWPILHDKSMFAHFTPEQLERLLVLVDKYDLHKILNREYECFQKIFWHNIEELPTPEWMHPVTGFGGLRCSTSTIALAWHLGLRDGIETWIHTRVDLHEEGQGSPFPDINKADVLERLDQLFEHGKLLESIEEEREKKIDDMCAIWAEHFEAAWAKQSHAARPGHTSSSSRLLQEAMQMVDFSGKTRKQGQVCQEAIYKSTIAQAHQLGIGSRSWFGPRWERRWRTPSECAESLMSISLTGAPLCRYGFRDGPERTCNPTSPKYSEVWNILLGRDSLLTQVQVRQLQTNQSLWNPERSLEDTYKPPVVWAGPQRVLEEV